MTAQITPGPWSVVPYGDEQNTNLVIHHSPQGRVCFMATPGQNRAVEEAQIAANAKAIAAVPAMIEALLLIRNDVAGYPAWDRPCHALDVVDAALKQAGVEV